MALTSCKGARPATNWPQPVTAKAVSSNRISPVIHGIHRPDPMARVHKDRETERQTDRQTDRRLSVSCLPVHRVCTACMRTSCTCVCVCVSDSRARQVKTRPTNQSPVINSPCPNPGSRRQIKAKKKHRLLLSLPRFCRLFLAGEIVPTTWIRDNLPVMHHPPTRRPSLTRMARSSAEAASAAGGCR